MTAATGPNEMEAKILKATKCIRLKSKPEVRIQWILRINNEEATVIESKQFQDLLQKLENEEYIYKKGKGKATFFLIAKNILDSRKNVILDTFKEERNDVSPSSDDLLLTVANSWNSCKSKGLFWWNLH